MNDRPLLVPERELAERIHDETVAHFDRHGVTPLFPGVRVLPLAEPGPRYEMRLVWRADASSAVVQTLRALPRVAG